VRGLGDGLVHLGRRGTGFGEQAITVKPFYLDEKRGGIPAAGDLVPDVPKKGMWQGLEFTTRIERKGRVDLLSETLRIKWM